MKAGSLASNVVIKNNSRLCGGSLASHNVMKSTKIGGAYGHSLSYSKLKGGKKKSSKKPRKKQSKKPKKKPSKKPRKKSSKKSGKKSKK